MGISVSTAVMAIRLYSVSFLIITTSIIFMTMGPSLSTSVTVNSVVANLFKNITCDLMKNPNSNNMKFFITLMSWLLLGGITCNHSIFKENPVYCDAVLIAFIEGYIFKCMNRDTRILLWLNTSRITLVFFCLFYYSHVAFIRLLSST